MTMLSDALSKLDPSDKSRGIELILKAVSSLTPEERVEIETIVTKFLKMVESDKS